MQIPLKNINKTGSIAQELQQTLAPHGPPGPLPPPPITTKIAKYFD
jgi:hypothetical protein